MTSRPGSENFHYTMPFGSLEQLNIELRALSRSEREDGTLAGGTDDEPSLFQLDRREHLEQREQMAGEVIELMQDLQVKLDGYLALQSEGSTDDTLKLESEAALAWVGTTIEDMVATIVGVEASPAPSFGHPES